MRLSLLLLTLLSATRLLAQSPEKNLEAFSANYPLEKVVLQFSKPAYIAGETIVFKAYVLTGHEPSTLSTNLYTELYDRDKNRLDSQLIYLSQGSGNGSFSLPASLAEDVYYIRAYTRWMLNFEESLQTIQPLPVYNPYSLQSLRLKPVQWTAKAFPEGGQLLDSAVANVAVRLYSEGTLPAQWSGTLVEAETNHPVANLTVYNNEIGQVRFLAYHGKTYKLLLKDDQGITKELLLPPVQTKGALLQASLYASKLRYSILFKDLPAMGNGYKLVAAINSQPVFVAAVKKTGGSIAGTIETKDMPPGILQLILLDEKGHPVTERLCFLHHRAVTETAPVLVTDTLSFAARSRNHWTLDTNLLLPETCSVQVTDAMLQPPTDFISSIYLTSVISTPVRTADWYFQNSSEEKTAALDALLLTETGKGYPWEKIIRKAFPAIRYQPDTLLSVAGIVQKAARPQANRNINLVLKAVDSSLHFLQVKTDEEGRFLLPELFFTDSLQVYFQPDKRKFLEGDITIQLIPQNTYQPLRGALPPSCYTTVLRQQTDTLPQVIKKALAQRQQELLLAEKTKMMQAVVVTAQARSQMQQLDEKLSSGLFKSSHATVFDFVNNNQTDLPAYNNILEWLQGRVPGFTLSRTASDVVPLIRNTPASVYLDEILVSSETVSSVSPQDVALIKVFTGGIAGGSGAGGSIAIYTRQGGMEPGNPAPRLQHATVQGYKRYTTPAVYDYAQQQGPDGNDERLLLFYQPFLSLDHSATKTSLVFYNNDTAKQYRVLVTGFNSEGKPVFLCKTLSEQ